MKLLLIGLVLGLFSIGLLIVIAQIPPDTDGRGILGGFVAAIGALNVIFHRTTARSVLRLSRSSRLLQYEGEDGLRVFYLGLGVVITAAGLLVLVADTEGLRELFASVRGAF